MEKNDDIKKLNLYALLGISSTAKVKEIKTAYRKKALTCHPDKNPDNPQAVKLFHQLNAALNILTNPAEKASYDKELKCREARKARDDALDSERKKYKTDLDERERKAEEEARAQQRLDRLKKQTLEEVKAEYDRVCQENNDRTQEKLSSFRRIRIRWKADKTDDTNGGYNEETLKNIFSKYGSIEALVISKKKKGSALLEFSSIESARRAQMLEVGHTSNSLSIKVMGGDIDEYRTIFNAVNSAMNPKTPPVIPSCSSKESQSFSTED